MHVERFVKVRNASLDLGRIHLVAQGGQFVHLDDLDVAAKAGALLGKIGIDVQHPAVVVAHHAQPIVLHDVRHAGRLNPSCDFIPARRVVVQHARDLVERDAGAVEHVGNFRDRAGGTVGEPLAGHLRAVAEPVEPGIVNRRFGREVEDDDRHLGPADDRQDGRRKGIRGGIQEDQVHVRLPEAMPGVDGLGRRVDQAQVDHLDAGRLQLVRDAPQIALQAFLQASELRPVRL